jgi:hypothetical protein
VGVVAWLNINTGVFRVFVMAQHIKAGEVGISARVCGKGKGENKRRADPRMVVDWAKTGKLID